MSGFTGSPRVLKGALVTVSADLTGLPSRVAVFQYNPESLRRQVEVNASGEGDDRGEALRLAGPPSESISLEVEIDATDQLADGDSAAAAHGIHPALARLELLLYPSSAREIANWALAKVGMIEVVPPEAPLTLLVWGGKRVLPVRLTSFTVNEEAFDPDLNPIRASVDLDVDVLTYRDLGFASAGGALSLAHHREKEALARAGSPADLSATGSFTGGF